MAETFHSILSFIQTAGSVLIALIAAAAPTLSIFLFTFKILEECKSRWSVYLISVASGAALGWQVYTNLRAGHTGTGLMYAYVLLLLGIPLAILAPRGKDEYLFPTPRQTFMFIAFLILAILPLLVFYITSGWELGILKPFIVFGAGALPCLLIFRRATS